MANTSLPGKIDNMLKLAERCFDLGAVGDYENLDLRLREVEAAAREALRAELQGEYQAIMKKLESGEPLTPADREVIKLIIVGDAEYYLNYENDYNHWLTELKRLMAELKQVRADGPTGRDALLRVQAFCRDGRGVLPDLTFYLRERERIERFCANKLDELDPELRQTLADILKELMTSSKT
jgi:hypothetical protein